jgi:methionyl-tRNA formyltransferase
MRIVFAGTPEFAARSLEALLSAGHAVVAVLTQPDRPAGRGLKPYPSAVKRVATAHGIAVYQPESAKMPEALALIESFAADVMVVAAYGLILPATVLSTPRLGCINVHASLLPRWRGAAPIQRALQAGDTETGISIMQMDAGLDTGPVLLMRSCPILVTDTQHTLHERLADLGARTLVEFLKNAVRAPVESNERPHFEWNTPPLAQSGSGVTYAAKITKAETLLDWQQSADRLARNVRAFNPAPVSKTVIQGEIIKVWEASAASDYGTPGTVMALGADSITVACAQGSLVLEMLQRPGGKPLSAGEFLKGFPMRVGEQLGQP